jgi:general secretion pathway protein E
LEEKQEAAHPKLSAKVAVSQNRALAELLLRAGCLSAAQLERAERVASSTHEPLDRVVTRLGLVQETALADALADNLALPRVTAAQLQVCDPELLTLFSPRFLRAARLLPLSGDREGILVAVANPLDSMAVDGARFACRGNVKFAVATATDIEAALARVLDAESEGSTAETTLGIDAFADDEDRLRELASDEPIIRLVNRWLAEAVEAGASDIHLEPTAEGLELRHRVDGELQSVEQVPANLAPAAVSRIKVMARLDIAEHRLPQDGKIRIAVRGRDVDIRVSVVPAIQGEAVVLRILDRSGLSLDLASLGYSGSNRSSFEALLAHPHGIVLVTGPTGSGKTTTLYAALLRLRGPKVKILTVEDPVEYQIAGAVQAQVNPAIGLDFATTLRSFLRHDPDIILVGEIRDTETARIAIQAALTGHLVLSTLHTNDAPSAIARLVDMGIDDYLIAATLRGVVAQRLVRRLCPSCREIYDPDSSLARRLGIRDRTPPRLHRAIGCSACRGTGFAGRIAVAEVLTVTDPIRRVLMQSAEPEDVRRAAAMEGFRTLLDNGIDLILAGETTPEEVFRATGET